MPGLYVLTDDARKATCAGGVVSEDFSFIWSKDHGVHVLRVAWPCAICNNCPLSSRCRGKDKRGRRMTLHPYEQELRAARETWRNPEVRALYRMRTQCERLVNQMTRYGGRQARAFGLGQAQVQAHTIAAACNLRLLARVLAVAVQREEQAAAA